MMIYICFLRLSFRKKIIITSILCLVLPAIFMLYNSNVSTQRIIQDQVLSTANQSLRIAQTQINAIVDDVILVSNSIQFDPELRTLLNTGSNDPLSSISITNKLEQLASNRTDFYLTLLHTDGGYYSNYPYYQYNPSAFWELSWFQQLSGLSAFDTFFLGAQPNYIESQSDKKPYVFIMSRAIMSKADQPFAYLIASITENTISDIFKDFTEDIYLLDESGVILSSEKPRLIGENFNSMVHTKTLNSPEIIKINGENQIFVSIPLRYAGWELVSLVPYEGLTDRLNRIYRSSVLIQALFVTAFMIILVFFLQKFTKPINVLGKVAKKVEAGQLDIRSNIRGSDEVGQFGRSFDQMLDKIQLTIDQVKQEQELKRQAELAMLQAQIQPHFLFNVLNSIRMKLLIKGDDSNAKLLESLSSLLRSTILKQQEFISLHAEIEAAKLYMDLMNFTMRYPLETFIDANSEVLLEIVPRFILQPMIENVFKHGYIGQGGYIRIRIDKIDDQLRISVRDNGSGMDKVKLILLRERLTTKKKDSIEGNSSSEYLNEAGIGLSNVYDRLNIIYGEHFKMKINSDVDQGTEIELIFPIVLKEDTTHA